MAVLPNEKALSFASPEVDRTLVPLLLDQYPVEPGQALRVDLARQLAGDVQFGLRTEFKRHQFTRPVADTVSDVVACDVQDLAIIGDAPDQDVSMGVTGVVVIDCYPIQLRPEIGFHLLHEAAGEGAQVVHLSGILRRQDEAELMPVLAAALDEGPAVGLVLHRRIDPPLLSVPRDAVPFEIAQMGIDRFAERALLLRAAATTLRIESDHARLDHDPPCPETNAAPVQAPPSAVSRKRCDHLRAAAPGVEPATSPDGPR
ncbi:hypothetical protein [Bradyrhizobium sp.]|uniref:hypothetical protein n=1 Tax=Bradyrhizobium sp. TaxID=376 RepID=UPI0025BDDC42|nr:hypothetical protein [Bradyrhizobium sp.]